ncbi:MAG: glycoside hydrolase family 3 C-terminal domain-containing protein [Bacteroidia bacterium]
MKAQQIFRECWQLLGPPEALLDIISGKVNPGGRMPFSTPASDEKAQNQKADVPGYMEGEDYALFRFDEGMGYSK